MSSSRWNKRLSGCSAVEPYLETELYDTEKTKIKKKDVFQRTCSVTESLESSGKPSQRKIMVDLLCELFETKSSELVSDGVSTENGTVKIWKRIGDTRTSEKVISTILKSQQRWA